MLSNFDPKSERSDFNSVSTSATLAMLLVSVALVVGEVGEVVVVVFVPALRVLVKISQCFVAEGFDMFRATLFAQNFQCICGFFLIKFGFGCVELLGYTTILAKVSVCEDLMETLK